MFSWYHCLSVLSCASQRISQEERRQNKALRARQLAERQDVQIAHNMQFAEFNAAWDRYLGEYDQMAQMYIKQMTEKHNSKLREFQQALHQELISRPPKFSRELLDWRKRQSLLAKWVLQILLNLFELKT